MKQRQDSDRDLGRTLAVVRPHPMSVLIGCVPGLVFCLVVLSNLRLTGLALLFHPEIELRPGMRPFMWGSVIVALLVLGLGLRHIFDRAELCQEGFRFLRKAYRYDQIGPISWSHHSQSGLTQFADSTTMRFQFQGKTVQLRTRYLQDLSYQYHRVYAEDPSVQSASNLRQAGYTNSNFHPR